MSSSLAKFSANLKRLPTVVAQKVAADCAPVLTALVNATFDASENTYGNLWIPGAEGQRVTLRKSGALASGLAYRAIGTKLRLRLATVYAKYQVGKRPVTPTQGAPLPVEYSRALERSAVETIKRELGQ